MITNLGYTNRTGPMYLNVGVWPTNYENSAHQWATVTLNGNVIKQYCTPDQSCGDRYYPCVSWMEISQNISSESGGSLLVEVSSSGVKSGPCDYEGCPLQAQVWVTESPPPVASSSLTIWVIIGTCIFVGLLIIIAIWYYWAQGKKKKEDTYGPSSSSQGAGADSRVEHDPEANQHGVTTKPVPSPRRSPRLHPSKIVPVEENVTPSVQNKVLDEQDVEAAINVTKNKSLLAHYELDE